LSPLVVRSARAGVENKAPTATASASKVLQFIFGKVRRRRNGWQQGQSQQAQTVPDGGGIQP
jgi:hypothetical protein